MQTKLNAVAERPVTFTEALSSPESMKDNFLMHLAPVSIGVFFFGNFQPNIEDKTQAQRALYKTSFLYRHFLQPGGLKAVIDEGCLTLSGKISSAAVSLMAQLLGAQIMGPIKIVDDTVCADESGRHVKTSEAAADLELRARLQLILATDAMLGSEEIEVSVSNGQAKVSGQVSSAEHKAWAETLLRSTAPQGKFSIQSSPRGKSVTPGARFTIDDDSLQALALTRLKLIPGLSRLDMRVTAQRQVLSLSGHAPSAAEKTLAESIVKHTYGMRDFKSNLSVKQG